MATRVVKMPSQTESAPDVDHVEISQRRRPEARYLLQVDRQTKSSHTTSEAAERAGALIKRTHPIVQVSVYDHVESVSKLIEAPAADVKA